MFAPMTLEGVPDFKTSSSRYLITLNTSCGRLFSAVEDCSAVRLERTRLIIYSCLLQEGCHRVFVVGTNSPKIVVAMAGVKPRAAIHQLRDSSTRLDTSDSGRLRNTQFGSPDFVGLDCNITQMLKKRRVKNKRRVVKNTSKGYTKKTFFVAVLLPNLPQVLEVCESRLYRTKYRCNSNLSFEANKAIFWSDNNFGKVAKLVWSKKYLGTSHYRYQTVFLSCAGLSHIKRVSNFYQT